MKRSNYVRSAEGGDHLIMLTQLCPARLFRSTEITANLGELLVYWRIEQFTNTGRDTQLASYALLLSSSNFSLIVENL